MQASYFRLAEGTTVQATLRPLVGGIKDLGMTSGSGLIVDPLEAVLGICESGRPDGAARHDHYIYRSGSAITARNRVKGQVGRDEAQAVARDLCR